MKNSILAAALMAFFQAVAATQTLKTSVSGTSFDWTDGANYKSGTAPAAGDTVVIPADVEAHVSAGTPSYELVSTLNRITPKPGATLRVTVDADASPATLGCAVSAQGETDYSGCLLKDGAGELELTANGNVRQGTANFYDYRCAFNVQSGTVKFVRNGVDKQKYYYGKVDVAAGATVFVCPIGYTYVTSFVGDGLVTNDTVKTTTCNPQVWIEGKDGDSFYGTIGGAAIPLYITGDWNLMNAEQSFSGSVMIRADGVFGVGELTKNGMSVFGVGSPNFSGDGSTLAFRGTKATSSSKAIWTTTASQILDGGAFGGVTWTGKFSGSSDQQQLLVLSGSNSTECLLQNQFVRKGDTGSYYVTKRGTGTWRFGDYERTLDGVIAVEEGTLRYDTIAPRGTACSLGTANLLYECKAGATSGLSTVPYAYLLGGDGTEGLMEYAGTNIVTCSDRPFAVRSQGGLRAQTGMTQFAGFTTADEDATLVLAGTNLYENTVSCVTNGAGVLSLLKKDSGLWVLEGDNDFSGSLVVSNGTLIVRKPELKYSYYQLVIKANGYTADWYDAPAVESNGKTIVVRNWGLFDANGVRQNVFSHAVADSTNGVEDTRFILPGQYGYYGENKVAIRSSATRHLGGMFYDDSNDGANWTQASYGLTDTNKPNTWVRIGCRLPNGTPTIVSTDIANSYGNGVDYSGRNVAAWQLEASADGKTWDVVAKDDRVVFPADGAKWDYGPNHKALDRTAPASVPTTSPLAGNPIVSVAPGAKLALEGDLTVSRLALSADGVGTIEGGSLAESGTLYVDDSVGTGNPVVTDFKGTAGVANLRGWTVNVNGTPTEHRVRVDASGRITICPPPGGLLMILR